MDESNSSSLTSRVNALSSLIKNTAPSFVRHANLTARELIQYLDLVYDGRTLPAESFPTVFSQLCNDFLDLLADLLAGRGRPAMRTARTIFESSITLMDVTSDHKLDDRYADHLWIAAFLESQWSLGEELLSEAERVSEKERRDKYQASARAKFDALTADEKYGKRFINSWIGLDLASRARMYGYGEKYPLYKIASAFVHSGAGGAHGIETLIDSRRVVRTGPALAACPPAAIFGVRVFRELFMKIPSENLPSADGLTGALSELEHAWPEYRQAVLVLDKNFWPASAPEQGFALVARVTGAGEISWFIADRRGKRLTPSQGPAENPAILRKAVAAIQETSSLDDNHSIFLLMPDIEIVPPTNSKWVYLDDIDPGAEILAIK